MKQNQNTIFGLLLISLSKWNYISCCSASALLSTAYSAAGYGYGSTLPWYSILGIVIGCLVGVGLIIGIIVAIVMCAKKKRPAQVQPQYGNAGYGGYGAQPAGYGGYGSQQPGYGGYGGYNAQQQGYAGGYMGQPPSYTSNVNTINNNPPNPTNNDVDSQNPIKQ